MADSPPTLTYRDKAWIEISDERGKPDLETSKEDYEKATKSPRYLPWKATGANLTTPPNRIPQLTLFILSLCVFLGSCLYGLSPSMGVHMRLSEIPPFVVVIDAGSTGTRMHTYCFSETQLCQDAKHLRNSENKPGLASCSDAECLSALLSPLLEDAAQKVPAQFRASTPLAIRATAGFRLLGRQRAEVLLKKIRVIVMQYGFKDAGVEVMTGDDEGLLQWIAVNSLLGTLNSNESTVVVMDLGGASTQIAYAVRDDIETTARQQAFIRLLPLPGVGRMVKVYVHSFLGYGVVAARKKILQEANISGVEQNPCLPSTELPADQGAPLELGLGGAQPCVQLISTLLRPKEVSCDFEASERCDFAKVWLGPMNVSNPIRPVGCSFYFYGLEDAGVVPSDANSAEVTPQRYLELAEIACTSRDLAATYPGLKRDQALWLCSDLCYIFTLLTVGFGIEANTAMLAVKSLPGPFSNATSASWSLGLALQLANVATR